MVSFEEGIAIAELCVYIPIFFLTLMIIFRQGFHRQFGWIYLSIFCIIRVIGAGLEISSLNKPTKTTIEWAAILTSVGLSPLLLASFGLLKRVTDQVSLHVRSNIEILPISGIIGKIASRSTANSRRSRILQLAQLPAVIALILCIAGGTSAADHPATSGSARDTKIGVVIFCVLYVLFALLTVITIKDIHRAGRGEKRIYIVIVVALPLIAVRLLWSVLAAFLDSGDFSLVGGKPAVHLVMATFEEFGVVCMYTAVGLSLGKSD